MSTPDGRALAERLSAKARGDELVLERLSDDPLVPDDLLGFHAQQAIEKMLKAAVAASGRTPPRIHDLEILVGLVVEAGLSPPSVARDVDQLTPWAVEFRYDDLLGESLDRRWARHAVAEVRRWLDGLLHAHPHP